MSINFDTIPERVKSFWVFMNVSNKGVGFNKVYNGICRLLSNKKEFCLFNVINNRDSSTNGVILCDF